MYLYSMTGIKDLKLLACFNFNFFFPLKSGNGNIGMLKLNISNCWFEENKQHKAVVPILNIDQTSVFINSPYTSIVQEMHVCSEKNQ